MSTLPNMETFQDLITAVYDDLTANTDSTLFPETTVKRIINRAYVKCGGIYRWPKLQDAKTTTTQTNIDYYDAPDTWRPDSMWRLEVDGEQYGENPDGSPLAYEDYLIWKANDADGDSESKKWATQWHRYFISPVPTNATSTITVWGMKNVEELTNTTDTTIFSYTLPEGNEAVVLEAVAMLKSKGEEEQKGQFRSAEAKQLLTVAWGKIRQERAKHNKNQPFFYVEDMFAGRSSKDSLIGQF
jgi:hypothetical protein